MAELKLTIDGLEKERDFYFGKLREIEVLCQTDQGKTPLVDQVLKILYATEVRHGDCAALLARVSCRIWLMDWLDVDSYRMASRRPPSPSMSTE